MWITGGIVDKYKNVALLKVHFHFQCLQVVFIDCAIQHCFSVLVIVIKECFSFYVFETSWCFWLSNKHWLIFSSNKLATVVQSFDIFPPVQSSPLRWNVFLVVSLENAPVSSIKISHRLYLSHTLVIFPFFTLFAHSAECNIVSCFERLL